MHLKTANPKLPATARSQEAWDMLSLTALRGIGTEDTLVLDFWPPECETMGFCPAVAAQATQHMASNPDLAAGWHSITRAQP